MSASTPHPSSQALTHRSGSDYYDLEGILFSQTAIPVTALVNAHGLGFLDPSGQGEEDLASGADLKLPIWLAESLIQKHMVTANIPKTHAKAIRHELRVDAASVSMAQNPYIYELGSILALMTGDTELPLILAKTFSTRFAQLWDSARNWRDDDTSTVTASMCYAERKLFARGYDSISDYNVWSLHKQTGISAASVIQTIAKNRKRARPISD
jgi:hypothetical protein